MILPVNEQLDVEKQVLLMLCLEIARGTYRPGDRAPSPLVLANQLLVDSRMVEAVYRRLSRAGILVEQPGRVYVVADAVLRARKLVAEWAKNELRALRGRLSGAGFTPQEIASLFRHALADGDEPSPGQGSAKQP